METLKNKIGIFIATLVGAVAILSAGYFLFFHKTNYWVQIDNANVSQLSVTEYEYELQAYNSHGESKEIKFKANKELRENAYLRLEVISTRGVYYWEEVSYDELPEDVRKNI